MKYVITRDKGEPNEKVIAHVNLEHVAAQLCNDLSGNCTYEEVEDTWMFGRAPAGAR